MTPVLPRDSEYFSVVRSEVAALLPRSTRRVLDVGCASGATVAFLKQRGLCEYAYGIELRPDVAELARGHVDRIFVADADGVDLDVAPASLDAILCLDVLEHLRNPWSFVRRIEGLLAPGGVLVASIPNARHYRVSFGLLFGGRWRYEDSGVLDRTHLRFFVRSTAVELVECGALRVDHVEPLGTRSKPGRLKWFVQKLSFGLSADLQCQQYLLRGVRAA